LDYITIVTPENIEIEYRLAGVGSRLGAVFVDFLIQLVAILAVGAFVLFGLMGFRFWTLEYMTFNGPGPAILIIAWFAIYLGYFVVCEMTMNGQTLGKKLFKLRVIRDNGEPIELPHSIVRNILRYVIDMTGVGPACIFFSKKHKRIGDMAASTIVVAENPAGHIESVAAPYEFNSIFQNLQLSDEEYYVLVEFFERRGGFLDRGEKLYRRITKYLSWRFGVPENTIDEELLYKLTQINRR
jgi:uncharacterized RDD family membrane protein YckC